MSKEMGHFTMTHIIKLNHNVLAAVHVGRIMLACLRYILKIQT